MALHLITSDALYDAIRSRENCKQASSEWDECEKLLETDIDSGYQSFMRSIMDEVEIHYIYKREREDVISIDSDDDCKNNKVAQDPENSLKRVKPEEDVIQGDKNDEVVPDPGKSMKRVRFEKDVIQGGESLPDQERIETTKLNFRSSSASTEFRERVMDVLSEPYDKEEYNRLRKDLHDGLHLNYHPDLGEAIEKHRYERATCVVIMRGFFFWLKNLHQEGSFKPWSDRQCLEVEPPKK